MLPEGSGYPGRKRGSTIDHKFFPVFATNFGRDGNKRTLYGSASVIQKRGCDGIGSHTSA
jgi:hypothetical protein